MFRYLSYFIIVGIGVSCASNKSGKEEMLETRAEIPYKSNEKSLFWEISGNGLKQPSYLFGTIHIIGKDDFFLGDNVEKAIKSADVFVTEVALNNLLNVDLMNDLMLPGDSSLKNIMKPEDYSKLKKFCEDSMDIDESVFEFSLARTSPIVLQQQITIMSFGDKKKSYELELANIAGNYDLENIGLETVDLQMEILGAVPLEDQITMLMYTIDSLAKANKELEKLIETYKNQDIDKLYKLIHDSDFNKEFMKHKREFLSDRNLKWIPKFNSLIKEKPCFIAVGAGHLSGDEGVIQLLRKEGYQVKPLVAI